MFLVIVWDWIVTFTYKVILLFIGSLPYRNSLTKVYIIMLIPLKGLLRLFYTVYIFSFCWHIIKLLSGHPQSFPSPLNCHPSWSKASHITDTITCDFLLLFQMVLHLLATKIRVKTLKLDITMPKSTIKPVKLYLMINKWKSKNPGSRNDDLYQGVEIFLSSPALHIEQ